MIVDEGHLLGALFIMHYALPATATPEVGWDGIYENVVSAQRGA